MFRIYLSLVLFAFVAKALKVPISFCYLLRPSKDLLRASTQINPQDDKVTGSQISAGEHVAKASSVREVLEVANLLCLPEDRQFKPHQKQLVHQRKRIRAATHALKRLSKWLIGVSSNLERNEITSSEEFQKLTRFK